MANEKKKTTVKNIYKLGGASAIKPVSKAPMRLMPIAQAIGDLTTALKQAQSDGARSVKGTLWFYE